MADQHGALRGCTVLVTRPSEVAAPLLELLKRHGAKTLHWPAISYRGASPEQVPELRERLCACDWLIFSSQQAVRSALDLLEARPLPDKTKLFAVGQTTGLLLRRAGYEAVWPEAGSGSEALLAMPEFDQVESLRIGIVCAPGGRQLLHETLRHAGAVVDVLETYHTVPGDVPAETVQQLETHLESLFVTATSGHILTLLAHTLDTTLAGNLLARPVVVPAPRLAVKAQDLGFTSVILAEGPLPRDLVQAMLSSYPCDNTAR